VILRPYLYAGTACASYLFGCLTERKLGVVDPHEGFVDAYLEESERVAAPIVAVFETHLQADHVSGLPALVEATGATAYPGSSSNTRPSKTAMRSRSGTRSCACSQRQAMRPRTTPM